jgi:hypothetical protein
MSLVCVYRCDCNPGFVYSSKETFAAHKKSKRHINYEMRDRVDDLQKRAVRLENEKVATECTLQIVYIIRKPNSDDVKVGMTTSSDITCLRKRYKTALENNFRILYWRVANSREMETGFKRRFQGTVRSGEIYDAAFMSQYVEHFTKLVGKDPQLNAITWNVSKTP